MLGLALAFLYENLMGGFTGDEQLAQVLKLPVAATVPRQGQLDRQQNALIVQNPFFVEKTAFGCRTTNMQQHW